MYICYVFMYNTISVLILSNYNIKKAFLLNKSIILFNCVWYYMTIGIPQGYYMIYAGPGVSPSPPQKQKTPKSKNKQDTSYNGGIDVNTHGLCLHCVYNSVYKKT